MPCRQELAAEVVELGLVELAAQIAEEDPHRRYSSLRESESWPGEPRVEGRPGSRFAKSMRREATMRPGSREPSLPEDIVDLGSDSIRMSWGERATGGLERAATIRVLL